MAIVINSNIASMDAQRNLSGAQSRLAESFNRLSSGYRINSAKDDAAGLAISDKMRSQIRSYSVAERNVNDGVSMVQTAEAALGQVTDLLGRMRELATQGANGVLTSADRSYLSTEFQQLQAEITRLQSSTKFNGKTLIGPPVVANGSGAITSALATATSAFSSFQTLAQTALTDAGNAYVSDGSPGSGPSYDAYVAALQGNNHQLLISGIQVTNLTQAQNALAEANAIVADYTAAVAATGAAGGSWSTAATSSQSALTAAQAMASALSSLTTAYQAGGAGASITFQVGIQNTNADRIVVSFGGLDLSAVTSLGTSVGGRDGSQARAALDTIDSALKSISTSRARYGAVMNRFDVVLSNTQTMRVNLSAANSRIRDVDVAEETAGLSRSQVLMQAGSSILAQANQAPQAALGLLR